jgi:hypothetical protein
MCSYCLPSARHHRRCRHSSNVMPQWSGQRRKSRKNVWVASIATSLGTRYWSCRMATSWKQKQWALGKWNMCHSELLSIHMFWWKKVHFWALSSAQLQSHLVYKGQTIHAREREALRRTQQDCTTKRGVANRTLRASAHSVHLNLSDIIWKFHTVTMFKQYFIYNV